MSGRLISGAGRLAAACLERIRILLNALGSVWTCSLMLLIGSDVFGRWLFDRPLTGVPEIVELSIAGIVFLQLGNAAATGRLMRSDALYHFILRRRPRLGQALDLFLNLAACLLFLLLVAGTWPRFLDAWRYDFYVGNYGVFTAPLWPVALIIVVGSALTALQYLDAVAHNIRSLVTGNRPGPGKPDR